MGKIHLTEQQPLCLKEDYQTYAEDSLGNPISITVLTVPEGNHEDTVPLDNPGLIEMLESIFIK